MSQPASPREVVENLIKGFENRAWGELSALYDENAVVEHPFNVPEPTRVEGRAALHERFLGASTRPFEVTPSKVVVFQTDDPEVVVVQYDYTVTVKTTGKTLLTPNILVVRVRDGLIVHSVDYHNHAAFAALLQQ